MWNGPEIDIFNKSHHPLNNSFQQKDFSVIIVPFSLPCEVFCPCQADFSCLLASTTLVGTVSALSLAGPSTNGCHPAQVAFSGFVPNTRLSFLSSRNGLFSTALRGMALPDSAHIHQPHASAAYCFMHSPNLGDGFYWGQGGWESHIREMLYCADLWGDREVHSDGPPL